MQAGYRDLQVWRRGKALAVDIYRLTANPPLERDFGLRDQMRRAAVSVPSNIAEGDTRRTDKDSVRFFYIAKGSLAELSTQLEIAAEIYRIADDLIHPRLRECDELGGMLQALIDHRRE